MAAVYLHEQKDFPDLLRILADERNILPGLIEKDYWIMQVLYGLKKQGYAFQLKGGTSLSKGFGIIDRFSEDLDLHIDPLAELGINENPKNTKTANIEKKRKYYDTLAGEIKIDGIIKIARDTEFDNTDTYNSGGIRLFYETFTEPVEGAKEGILLEVGFDNVAPNSPVMISSWAYERAQGAAIELIDNRAVDIYCYHPGYTFVEKLQTIATKFRKEISSGEEQKNYMRQYYDVYSLLNNQIVLDFIATDDYKLHKEKRFPAADRAIPIKENEAFLLNNAALRDRFQKRYEGTKGLYYKGQPPFNEVMARIQAHVDQL
ncbi:MAG TPA: nucleotidyl transferase AbiEii/AbiGii toxin family protein [Agriterribacter sp.]|nr:nucleotidyl transferase AbiEii/AbiGii toxin family protein [Agriterribacter sp.]HRQ51024.1 nucleotidyl transferase AbiEii/AbiGii toxin family protein [Agriterribacter sp.]